MDDAAFRERYGPWALVAGASEGVGVSVAHALAARGVNLVLLARREAALDAVAASVRSASGVDTRVLAVDLTADDAMDRIAAATADLQVGFVLYGAGADPDYRPFLSQPVDAGLALVQRNCAMSLRVLHHFAGPMVERGRGALAVLSSGAGLAGGPNMVAYAATKAFDTTLAQSMWAELQGTGVDVLAMVLGMTDTPALRRLLVARGALAGEDEPVPGADTPEAVAAELLAHLADGPTWFMGEMLQAAAPMIGGMARRDAVLAMAQGGGLPGTTPA